MRQARAGERASQPSVDSAGNFDGTANVNVGTNTVVAVVATDASGNSRTNNHQINVSSGTSATFLYDLNANLTNDGTKTYEWDAANRVIAINNGTHRSEFTYDGATRRTKIVEKDNGNVTTTKQFVWCMGDPQPCEERDTSNNVTKRFYSQGEQIGATSYYYTKDHLRSTREMTDNSGVIHARYDYDPYGRLTKVQGDLDSDFTYAGYYNHSASGLYATLNRFYNPDLGRWISRDPIGENPGINLYAYVGNGPISALDPFGLKLLRLGNGWIADDDREGKYGYCRIIRFPEDEDTAIKRLQGLPIDTTYDDKDQQGDPNGIFATHYGPGTKIGGWDPDNDSGTNAGLDNHGNPLNDDSLQAV